MGGQDPAERPTERTRAHVFAGAVRKPACFSNSRLSDKRRQISHKNCVFLNFKKQGTSLVVKTASFQHRNVSLTPGWGMKILWAALAWGSRERLGRSACQGQGHRGRRLQEATVSPSETRLAKRRGGGEGTAASQAQTWSQRPCPESGPQAGEALWAEAGQGAPVKGREGLRAGPPVWEDSPHPQPATLLVSDTSSPGGWGHTVHDTCRATSSASTAHSCFPFCYGNGKKPRSGAVFPTVLRGG